ncbi:MAG: hypothetical protein WBL28_04510 [Methylotenera sp.]
MPKLLIFLCFFFIFISAQAKTTLESRLLGAWCASSTSAFYEEFNLEIENGQHHFRSYLHHRPGEFGDWRIEKKQLVITTFNTDYKYRIVKLTHKRLVLTNDAGHNEQYKRCG